MSENPGRLNLEAAQSTPAWTSTLSSPPVETMSGTREEVCPAEVEDYLDHLTAGLLALPYAARTSLREEVRQHLLAAIAAREEIGMEHAEAIRETLSRFGEPCTLSAQFTETYSTTGPDRFAFPRDAYIGALKLFGMTAVLTPFVLVFLMKTVHHGAVPLSVVDPVAWFSVMLLIPALHGFRIGRRQYARPGLGTLFALATLCLLTLPVAWLGLHTAPQDPSFEAWVLLPVLVGWWTLIAPLSAGIYGRIVRSGRPHRPRAFARR